MDFVDAAVPLSNLRVILIVIAIFALIFLANFVMPPLSEKMICGLQGGQWDTMLRVCAFDPKVCEDADGISVIIPEEWDEGQWSSSNATTWGCKFGWISYISPALSWELILAVQRVQRITACQFHLMLDQNSRRIWSNKGQTCQKYQRLSSD